MMKELGAVMNLLGNKGKLQEEVARFQQSVSQITAEGTAGGGMVTVKVNGRMELTACRVSEEAWKLDDREMVEDLIVAAANQALAKVREQVSAETARMAGNLGLPPGMLGGMPGLG
jgi:DNA-binding YbaB/EbfC family protein